MHRNKSVDLHQFSMIPRADIPRSSFRRQFTHKTTFDAGKLIPFYVDEVLPGDTFNLHATLFARLATPIFPVMDNIYLDTFFFFVPNRLVWVHWREFMGQQLDPSSSISYTIPQITSPTGGFVIGGLGDYFGLPTVGSTFGGGNVWTGNALPFRGYTLIWNEWFRDENLQNSQPVPLTDGPDTFASYPMLRRGKRHDYFTSCLPWTQKGGVAVTLPLGTSAPVKYLGGQTPQFTEQGGPNIGSLVYNAAGQVSMQTPSGNVGIADWNATAIGLYADLSAATAATINQLRQSFQIQKLLERDARGGTRYTEIVRSHFGVISPDARLQRPEYLGGGSSPINISPIAQTSGTGASGTTAPLANLSAFGTVLNNNGFTQSFTEHGYVFGLCAARADLTYQQGVRRMWRRSTRYDFYFPVFATLGEQAVLNEEIFSDGSISDTQVFGYQERWAEYRYLPSMITGQFRSTYATPLDAWHLAQNFAGLPALDATFIVENPPINRVVAVGSGAAGQQFLLDCFVDCKTARPMPLYSVPGLVDHF